MSWRSGAQRTGENAAPLTKVRRWGGGDDQQQQHGAPAPPGFGAPGGGYAPPPPLGYDTGAKRGREEPAAGGSAEAPRKRRSRWGDAPADAASGVATAIGANVPAAELERYALQVRLDEIGRKLATGNVVPPERERSPSPPPTYDGQGRRTNTREVRYTKKLEHERVALMDKAMKLDPNYRPPAEYHAAKRNMKPSEKVYLPLKEFPDINFFGLLVGPRGNTLKKMERESGAKISIRGKGSVKEGKGRPGDEDDEEMHCVVTADDNEKVKKCIKLINLVIETAASTPEAQNDHKRNQLRELAALNGTLRDDEGQVCQNCGQKGHRRFMCPEERNVTAHIICHRCGGQGHLARDCTQQPGMMGGGGGGGFGGPGGPGGPGAQGPGGQFDSEYANLMAELGEGGAPGAQGPPRPGMPGPQQQQQGQPNQLHGPDGKKIPPWRDPNMWNPPGHGGRMMGGGGMGMGMGMGGQRFGGAPGGMAPNGGMPMDQGWGARQQQQQWGAPGYGQQAAYGQPMPAGQPDYTKEWEEYHRQQALAAAGGAGSPQQPGAPGAAGAAAAGQPDYTKQWEEYYRLQAAAAAGGAAAPAAAAAAAATTAPAPAAAAGEAKDYTKEWEEYNRQQAALAAAAAAGGAPAY